MVFYQVGVGLIFKMGMSMMESLKMVFFTEKAYIIRNKKTNIFSGHLKKISVAQFPNKVRGYLLIPFKYLNIIGTHYKEILKTSFSHKNFYKCRNSKEPMRSLEENTQIQLD